ncbi:hypothetical protein OQA88_3184 [Cercophora sp. LCS_1]
MRLLDTLTLELVDFTDDIPLYAILSHRWGDQEPTLQDFVLRKAKRDAGGNPDEELVQKAGFVKVQRFCSVAASQGLQYGWVDTCCIDKTSSADLSEAINSMYWWYEGSTICFVYLGDVGLDSSASTSPFIAKRYPGFSKSSWFSRGWTLQELIAPSMVVFLDDAWQEIDTKSNLCSVLSGITGIPDTILAGESPYTASIAQRMSWASSRTTTRVEDSAYSLMGLFDVNMPMLYGEGEKAFFRLQQEIIKTSDDHSIFAWERRASDLGDGNDGLFATSPAAFSSCRDMVPWDSANAQNTLSRAISTDNKGIHLNLMFVQGKEWDDIHVGILPCGRAGNFGKGVGIPLKARSPSLQCFTRVPSGLVEMKFMGVYPEKEICVQHLRRSSREKIAIVKAAESGNLAVVRFFLEKGEETELRDEHGRTPLLAAAKGGHSNVVELLIMHGSTIEAVDFHGYTPLLLAAMGGHATTAAVLIDKGARIDASSGDGQTPLFWAAQEGHEAVVRVLLQEGADVHVVDDTGSTALQWAVLREQGAVAKALIKGGADLTVVDEAGQTALHCAAESGQTDIVRLLLAHGADIEQEDVSGNTALGLALERDHRDVARLLTRRVSRIRAGVL